MLQLFEQKKRFIPCFVHYRKEMGVHFQLQSSTHCPPQQRKKPITTQQELRDEFCIHHLYY